MTIQAMRSSDDIGGIVSWIAMTATLDPAHALAYLRLLSTDIRSAAVLSAAGELLAGDAELAVAAMSSDGSGSLLAVRDERHVVAVDLGPHAVGALASADLRTVLKELA